MKIGVLSDTHGRLDWTRAAIHHLDERGAGLILHCGDIDSTTVVRLFTGRSTHFVFGNWDLRQSALRAAMRDVGAVCHGEVGRLGIAGKRIGWLHGHVRGQRLKLEGSGQLDYLFYGHSHRAEAHHTGKTLVLNPGALHRASTKSVAVVDVASGAWDLVAVPEPVGGSDGDVS